MSGFPPLPPINDMDMVLAVFTHESLLAPAQDDFREPRRLVHLGERVLEQAITYHYFMKKPVMPADEIEEQLQHPPFDFHRLLYEYGLKEKIRYAPGQFFDSPEEAKQFFSKYIGAAFLQNGIGSIQEWVSQTLDPGCITPSLPTGNTSRAPQPSNSNFSAAPPPPNIPPPSQPPPPSGFYQQAQSPPSMTNARGFQILAQFNMTAHQRGYTVTYPARSEGPHHTPTWHVQCCLDNQVKGEGSGQNQKQAKELAARQAWMAMGWGTLPES
ncbi:hypothetical protein Agabi119p4_280 [Agaricus bisporus var. burnettii]|uniref:DRBM domain-containing protein n=1 Tax=Agaricus bisporus var. burnettii TaxID=192524 RepID=A0A8H7FAI3_AGABI|nr:hypothetical protein Agabi119p4_280 [Agaricus bisporus var. burnettii]